MSLIPNPVSAFISANKPLLLYAGIIVAVIVLLTLAYCAGGGGVRAEDDRETIKMQTQTISADGNASDARVADTMKIKDQEQELKDVAKSTATSTSDDARRARLCVVMRQQGRNATADASGCGPSPAR
ncbi:hypothetical protein PX554_18050 [Sphingomonas sp. H39-1-10]|uniref:hypothetical protein n=1 Tax=Sphingomonas pollutisoli TaxID=3030829 RepID=UPI0023BA2EDE|nr:hypothetical protein [Sphingomonas pollutisoli]MDF0490040.1 hypothetical protein [Sphingomonas pollutisoli]